MTQPAAPTGKRKPGSAAQRAARNLEEGGELGPERAERVEGPAGTGRPTGREAGTPQRCGAVAVAVAGAGYILHLRESNPRSGEKRRQRRSAGGIR